MAVGKNKVERWITLTWDDDGSTPRDLTPDLLPGTLSGGGLTLDEVEMTGVSDEVKNFLTGHANSEISGQFYLDDTATTGAHTVLIATVGLAGTLTIAYGAGAAPTSGDPDWEGEYVLVDASVVLSGNKPVIQARWLPSGSIAPVWGTVT